MSAPLGGLPGFALRPLGGLILFCIGFVVVFSMGDRVNAMIVAPICAQLAELGHADCGLVYTSPQEVFFTTLRQSALAGMILALPCLMFQSARLIAPTLFLSAPEKLLPLAIASGILAFLGAGYALMQAAPNAMEPVLAYIAEASIELPMLGMLNSYLRAAVSMAGSYVLVLQIPVALIMIVKSMRLRRALQSEVEA